MGHQPAFVIAPVQDNGTVVSPFWDKGSNNKSKVRTILKKTWKWGKLMLLIFVMVIGLWGCFQSGDQTVASSTTLGEGLEFGFPYGTTGDYRYDLSSDGAPGYRTFTQFSFDYGPFFAFFIWIFANLFIQIMYSGANWFGGLNALLAIFTLLMIVRSVSLLITIRSAIQNEKMNEVQGLLAEITAKYKDLTDMQSRQQRQMEISAAYKKYNIKPFAAIEQMLITLPIFMIISRLITIVRPMKTVVLLGIWNYSVSPLSEVFTNFANGGAIYILLMLILVPIQALSVLLPQIWAKRRNRKATPVSEKGRKKVKTQKLIQIIMVVVVCVVVCSSPTGVGVYWFLSSLFTIGQQFVVHSIIMKKRRVDSSLDKRLERLGLE